MHPDVTTLFESQGGVATTAQILGVASRRHLQELVECAALERLWHGVYSSRPASTVTRLRGLDLLCGEPVGLCLGTAAGFYGFDTEGGADLHIINPANRHIRSTEGLVVHRRLGAPMTTISGRPATEPAWTAVEVARSLTRRRALATLDAALRSGHCDPVALAHAATTQTGRRGIVRVRSLIPLADGLAESPMESEARLVMIDGGLPMPVLQHEIIDSRGRLRRLDFAWPAAMVAAEYDSSAWHATADALRRDRVKFAAVQEAGWTVIPLVADDVRRHPQRLVRRIAAHLRRASAA